MTESIEPDQNKLATTPEPERKRVTRASTDSVQSKRSKPNDSPRWRTQSYLLFLALRQHPEHSLPRGQLIKEALALDRKFSKELGLPLVYNGKTPDNSASSVLTKNDDRYFIPFKPEGSRSTHFRLAYEPGNVDTALQEYQKWCKKLVEHDWPYCFGVPKVAVAVNHYHTPVSDVDLHEEEEVDQRSTEDASNVDKNHEQELIKSVSEIDQKLKQKSTIVVKKQLTVKESNRNRLKRVTRSNSRTLTVSSTQQTSAIEAVDPAEKTDEKNVDPIEKIDEKTNVLVESKSDALPLKEPSAQKDKTSHSTLLTQPNQENGINKCIPEPLYTLDQLDLTNIPQSWRDIVTIAPSKIANAGNGLFATRTLPYNTPIGFYFGVPMTEDKFDSLKDRVGRSSEYSIMYRRTVLDATDDQGKPITDPSSPRFCPFHFMNETSEQTDASVAFVEGFVVNQVICWTRKEIQPGEELLAWYGADVNRYWQQKQVTRQ